MSDNLSKNHLWLIGAGPMAVAYAKVLAAQHIPFQVIGRGANSAATFTEQTGVPVRTGGVQTWPDNLPEPPSTAIVAINVEQLAEITLFLLRKGVRRILVEKPAGLDWDEIKKVEDESERQNAQVYVAYNRRFYASTIRGQEIIQADGGIMSFNFEFNERSHRIASLKKDPRVKGHWFLANSTHVVDLAFFLGGIPKEISCYKTGGLWWHPSASVFSGAGITEKGTLFSYDANWEAPGRWGLEILTRRHRLIFRPMESLQIQYPGTDTLETVALDDSLDRHFKPGLYRQVDSFLNHPGYPNLCRLYEHSVMTKKVYSRMSGEEVTRLPEG